MQELDGSVQDTPVAQQSTEGCGMPPMGMNPMDKMGKPDVPPPSMSVNINAQGLDNIEDMMRLFQKVNPDMMPMDKPEMPPMPSLTMPPSIMSVKPELPPLKMLPDMDADNDEMPGGEKDVMMKMDLDKDEIDIKGLDRDGDGDHDMDDHRMEPKGKKQESSDDEWEEGSLDQFVNTNDYNFELEYTDDWDAAEEEFIAKVKREGHKITDINRDATPVVVAMAGDDFVAWYDFENTHGFIKPVEEAWENEPDESERSIDYMNNKLAGGMNRPKDTFPKVSDADNPMKKVREDNDLRAQIRAELQQRLAEAKGAK